MMREDPQPRLPAPTIETQTCLDVLAVVNRNSVLLQKLSHFPLHFTHPHEPGQNRTSIST